jgi:hypothetical protein
MQHSTALAQLVCAPLRTMHGNDQYACACTTSQQSATLCHVQDVLESAPQRSRTPSRCHFARRQRSNLAMPVEAVLTEVATASVSGKRASARARYGSHFVGIKSHGKRRRTQVREGNYSMHLGTFSEAEAAARAYDAVAWRSCGRCGHVSKSSHASALNTQVLPTAGHAPSQA